MTNEFLNQYPPFEDQADIFLKFIGDDTLIIHNADFDMGFINNELKLMGRDELTNKVIDTVSLARKTLNTRIANLDYLCRRFSIDLTERSLHGALLDTQLLAEVYLELKGGKQISMNLNETTTKKKKLMDTKPIEKTAFLKISLEKNEISKHKIQLKQIKNPLWEKIDY